MILLLVGLGDITGVLNDVKKEVNNSSPSKRNLSMVFQKFTLYPHSSLRGATEEPIVQKK